MLPWEAGRRFFALTVKPSFDSFIPQRFGGRGYPPPADEKRQDNVSFVSWSCLKKCERLLRWSLGIVFTSKGKNSVENQAAFTGNASFHWKAQLKKEIRMITQVKRAELQRSAHPSGGEDEHTGNEKEKEILCN